MVDMGMNQQNEVVVAIRAAKEINKSAMEWALNHIVQPGNCIKLLVVITPQKFGKKLWGFHRFATDCATGQWRSHTGTLLKGKDDFSDSCSQLMHQLREIHDSHKVPVKVKILSGLIPGVVAAEAKRSYTNWAILDNKLKSEVKHCMEELKCNVVVVKRSQAKVLRLNLVESGFMEPEVAGTLSSELKVPAADLLECNYDLMDAIRGPNVTPISSPEQETSFSVTDIGTSSISSSDQGTSPVFPSAVTESQIKGFSSMAKNAQDPHESDSDMESEILFSSFSNQPWMLDNPPIAEYLTYVMWGSRKFDDEASTSTSITSLERCSTLEEKSSNQILRQRFESKSCQSVREVIALTRHSPADPPPLCSVCQHKAPIFGKSPKSFSYTELELATDRFSELNFLAEGGFGSVYRGILPDGQVVAVKQHKPASSQGDLEFCSEVEVLSCAQHRNVVLLIGFCVEGGKRLLVYEYICNGSLDSHLFGKTCKPLEWCARKKIAVGAARGLRYLHEECRVGCIVHRDMRPNNILITHDFEALVGDFGLARCQPNGGLGEETRVIGTLGFLAPEYARSGQITEKADVYSFGIVLLELVTGRKAVDINRPKGEQCLTQWARHLLKKQAFEEMVDPRIGGNYSRQDVSCMLQCAFLCINRDPDPRPRMSQVLRMLEGDVMMNSIGHAWLEKSGQ